MQRYLRGQIWWCKNTYDVNSAEREIDTRDSQKLFDHLQKGMRPVLIVSNNIGNRHSEILQVIPCTTADKNSLPTHYTFFLNKTKNTLLCEQIKTVNKSDMMNYMTTFDEKEMEGVERCMNIALGLEKITNYNRIVLGVENESKSIIIKGEENKDDRVD